MFTFVTIKDWEEGGSLATQHWEHCGEKQGSGFNLLTSLQPQVSEEPQLGYHGDIISFP